MTTSTATLNLDQVAEFWRIARRLYSVYIELDHTFELDIPPCPELDDAADSPDPDARERVLQWFEQIDGHVQVWQLRQLLQSTSLQNEENLRYLIARHLDKKIRAKQTKTRSIFCWCNTSHIAHRTGRQRQRWRKWPACLNPQWGKRLKLFLTGLQVWTPSFAS